jgi:uncharacterized protein involved in exopolysaccharide biosynthesis/Mrp family chromosome partitioning ATPase
MTRLVPTSRAEAPLALMVDPIGNPLPFDQDPTTGDLWRILWRRKGLIAFTAGVLCIVALAYGLTTPPLFTTSAELIIDPRDRQVVVNDVNPSAVAPDGGTTQVESQVQVIQSASVLLRAMASTDLTHDPEFSDPGLLAWATNWWHGTSAEPQTEATVEARTLRMLKRRLNVTRAEKVFVININVTANAPDKAARIANAIADSYLADQAEAKAQAIRRASNAFSARLDEQRKHVEALDNEIQDYRRSHNIVVANGQFVGDQTLVDFIAQLTVAQSRTATLRAKIDQLREANVSTAATPEALLSPVISRLREEEGLLVQHQAEMESRLGPQYPSIAAVRAQLASVRQLIASELNRILSTMQGEYSRALINEKLLSAQVERARAETLAVRQSSVKLRELERDLEASRSVYATFLARAQETSQQIGIDSTNARIITRATPPIQKSWPPLTLLVMGAIGTGIGLGSGFALIREYITPTVLSRGQIERIANAPVVGILPGTIFGRRRSTLSDAMLGSRVGPNVMAVLGLALRRLFDPSIDPASRDLGGMRSLLVNSGTQDADVRREVCNLFASTAAMRGDKVLLVDADVAGGQPGAAAGLLDVLHGEHALSSLVDVAPVTGVALLGKGRDQRSSVLRNQGWSDVMRMLSQARQHFDLVIIDGGVLAENLQIAPLLSVADTALLVGQLGKTTQNDVNRAVDAAMVMGRRISAVVLIDPTEQG